MTDQYGDPVPDDLVVLVATDGTPQDISDILALRWYEAGSYPGTILVSAATLTWASPDATTDLEDAGITLDHERIYRIPHALKRYNEVDGFYHV